MHATKHGVRSAFAGHAVGCFAAAGQAVVAERPAVAADGLVDGGADAGGVACRVFRRAFALHAVARLKATALCVALAGEGLAAAADGCKHLGAHAAGRAAGAGGRALPGAAGGWVKAAAGGGALVAEGVAVAAHRVVLQGAHAARLAVPGAWVAARGERAPATGRASAGSARGGRQAEGGRGRRQQRRLMSIWRPAPGLHTRLAAQR